VWDVAEEDVVVQLARKGITKESWPIVQWTGDDSTCFYAVTNTVHAFSRADNFSSE
jgi:translation initiation factor 2A